MLAPLLDTVCASAGSTALNFENYSFGPQLGLSSLRFNRGFEKIPTLMRKFTLLLQMRIKSAAVHTLASTLSDIYERAAFINHHPIIGCSAAPSTFRNR